jgi:hypothetical protein
VPNGFLLHRHVIETVGALQRFEQRRHEQGRGMVDVRNIFGEHHELAFAASRSR